MRIGIIGGILTGFQKKKLRYFRLKTNNFPDETCKFQEKFPVVRLCGYTRL